MSPIKTTDNGRSTRSLLVPIERPNSFAGRLGKLEKPVNYNTVGSIKGGDPNTDISYITRTVQFILDGGGSILSLTKTISVPIHFAFTIAGVTLLSENESGSVVVDIQKNTYAVYPTGFASICASAKPTISSAWKSEDNVLTGWDKSCIVGDVLRFNIDSVIDITQLTIGLKIMIAT